MYTDTCILAINFIYLSNLLKRQYLFHTIAKIKVSRIVLWIVHCHLIALRVIWNYGSFVTQSFQGASRLLIFSSTFKSPFSSDQTKLKLVCWIGLRKCSKYLKIKLIKAHFSPNLMKNNDFFSVDIVFMYNCILCSWLP